MDAYGKWEVIRELGEGGQGKVFLVRDTKKGGQTGKLLAEMCVRLRGLTASVPVPDERERANDLLDTLSTLLNPNIELGAMKVLHAPKSEAGFDKAVERLKQEINTLEKVNHPNVLKILDYNVAEKWFVGEYHDHGTLWQKRELFKGNMTATLTAFRPLVQGVAELHKSGCIHRDIKPHNVFIAADGRLILGDFGIVYFNDPNRTRVTDTYENVGSRDWMAPWTQSRLIEDLRPNCDVFSLGKLLWAMLSGRGLLPFWYHHRPRYELEEMFPDQDDVKWARRILDKCIVEEEEHCLASASDLLDEIDTVLNALMRIPTQIGTHSAGKSTLVPIQIGTCSEANRHPVLG